MTLSAGTNLGPYEILSPLGAGGMGEVYRAKDTKLHREVAIKVLPADVAYQNQNDPTEPTDQKKNETNDCITWKNLLKRTSRSPILPENKTGHRSGATHPTANPAFNKPLFAGSRVQKKAPSLFRPRE